MGKLEEVARKNIRKTRVQEAILTYILSGGRVGGDKLIRQVADSLLGTDFSTPPLRRIQIIRSAASRLASKGLVKYTNNHYSLTTEGEKILDSWHLTQYTIKRPNKWDGKWRVIIFDIPETKKKVRDRVREILIFTGFQRLQNSVWIYPYDCEDVIGLMKVELGIGKYLLYMIVDQVENDRFLRMDFGLIT